VGYECEIRYPFAVSSIETMTDDQFERHALEVLARELGADGLARFLRLHRSGPGDSTKDRMQWQKNLTIQEVLDSINLHRHGQKLCQNCAKTPSLCSARSCCLSESNFPKLLISSTSVWSEWNV
jgi:hypothetical protein